MGEIRDIGGYVVRQKATWLTNGRKVGLFIVFLSSVAFNGAAWRQAWAMTHYVNTGVRTASPEALSASDTLWTVLTGVNVLRPENSHTPRDIGLAFSVRQIGLLEGGYLEAWYVPRAPSRGLVLMFPGYASSKESLLVPAAAFHKSGYATLMVDFRGAGGSSGQDTTLGAREATDVARAVAYAQQSLSSRPLVLYGVSMGSAAILRAVAMQGVHPDALILEAPFDRLLSTVRNRFQAMGLPTFPAAAALIFWGSVQQGTNGFADNPVDYAVAVKCPTLLLHGNQDPRVTIGQNDAIFAKLGGYKELVNFPKAGHEGLFISDPTLWTNRVGQFLMTLEHSPESDWSRP